MTRSHWHSCPKCGAAKVAGPWYVRRGPPWRRREQLRFVCWQCDFVMYFPCIDAAKGADAYSIVDAKDKG